MAVQYSNVAQESITIANETIFFSYSDYEPSDDYVPWCSDESWEEGVDDNSSLSLYNFR